MRRILSGEKGRWNALETNLTVILLKVNRNNCKVNSLVSEEGNSITESNNEYNSF